MSGNVGVFSRETLRNTNYKVKHFLRSSSRDLEKNRKNRNRWLTIIVGNWNVNSRNARLIHEWLSWFSTVSQRLHSYRQWELELWSESCVLPTLLYLMNFPEQNIGCLNFSVVRLSVVTPRVLSCHCHSNSFPEQNHCKYSSLADFLTSLRPTDSVMSTSRPSQCIRYPFQEHSFRKQYKQTQIKRRCFFCNSAWKIVSGYVKY